MEQEKLSVTVSESNVLGDTKEDMGKVTPECALSCDADTVAASQTYNQVGFLTSFSPSFQSYPIGFCRNKQSYVVLKFVLGGVNLMGNVLHSIRGSAPPSRANKYQNE